VVALERRLRTIVAVELVTAGIGLSLLGINRSNYIQPPTPHVQRAASLANRSLGGASAPETARSQPVGISIPALRISSALGPARGLNEDGTISDAPLSGPTWSLPWWYDGGPAPGEAGSAVLLGHVDSAVGAGRLGVFFRLGELAPGDTILVQLADGLDTRWTTVSTALYPDRRFPDALVYSRSGAPTLRLVTCGGRFDPVTGHYESAVVVTALEEPGGR
jgi:hypothetical protein